MFIATLFTIAKIWKQAKCSSTDEWINKMCYIYTHAQTMKYYSTIRKKEILLFEATWGHMLSEKSQTEKDKYCMISLIFRIQKNIRIDTENRLVVSRG